MAAWLQAVAAAGAVVAASMPQHAEAFVYKGAYDRYDRASCMFVWVDVVKRGEAA